MQIDVVMPQMGESIAEGTITRWLKKVGDKVDRDEPIFEISTDKVDAEIPAPAAGIVEKILIHEGETVPVGTQLAVIGRAATRGEGRPWAQGAPDEDPGATAREAVAAEPEPRATPVARPMAEPAPAPGATPVARRVAAALQIDLEGVSGTGPAGRVTKRDVQPQAHTLQPEPAPDPIEPEPQPGS